MRDFEEKKTLRYDIYKKNFLSCDSSFNID